MEAIDPSGNILIIDDDEDDYILTRAMILETGKGAFNIDWAVSYQEGLQKIQSDGWAAVLVDYDLGPQNGIQLIREAISRGSTAPFIMITGRGRYEVDLEAMQAGAFDYVTKSELSPPLLERVIRYAKERQRIEASLEARVEQRTEELQSALEELQVMEEELRTQLDESLRSGADRNASNERYRDLFESAPSPYFVTDPLGIILTPNRAAVRLFERDEEFLVGKPLSVFIAEDDRPAFRSFINRLPQTKGVQELNLRMQPHPNETVDVQMLVSPVRGADGQVITIRWLVYVKKPA